MQSNIESFFTRANLKADFPSYAKPLGISFSMMSLLIVCIPYCAYTGYVHTPAKMQQIQMTNIPEANAFQFFSITTEFNFVELVDRLGDPPLPGATPPSQMPKLVPEAKGAEPESFISRPESFALLVVFTTIPAHCYISGQRWHSTSINIAM